MFVVNVIDRDHAKSPSRSSHFTKVTICRLATLAAQVILEMSCYRNPASSDLSLNRLDAAGELSAEVKAKERMGYSEAKVSPELKGFALCDVVRNIDGLPSAINSAGRLYANRIDGKEISEELQRIGSNFDYAFQRDENVYFYKSYSLVSLFGGL